MSVILSPAVMSQAATRILQVLYVFYVMFECRLPLLLIKVSLLQVRFLMNENASEWTMFYY